MDLFVIDEEEIMAKKRAKLRKIGKKYEVEFECPSLR